MWKDIKHWGEMEKVHRHSTDWTGIYWIINAHTSLLWPFVMYMCRLTANERHWSGTKENNKSSIKNSVWIFSLFISSKTLLRSPEFNFAFLSFLSFHMTPSRTVRCLLFERHDFLLQFVQNNNEKSAAALRIYFSLCWHSHETCKRRAVNLMQAHFFFSPTERYI